MNVKKHTANTRRLAFPFAFFWIPFCIPFFSYFLISCFLQDMVHVCSQSIVESIVQLDSMVSPWALIALTYSA